VCGSSWAQAKTVIVPDVENFPGHIACSSLSRSEIVVPVLKKNEVVAVLDADSTALDAYDETDQRFLEAIVALLQF
jgi:GAF domain-containing protein